MPVCDWAMPTRPPIDRHANREWRSDSERCFFPSTANRWANLIRKIEDTLILRRSLGNAQHIIRPIPRGHAGVMRSVVPPTANSSLFDIPLFPKGIVGASRVGTTRHTFVSHRVVFWCGWCIVYLDPQGEGWFVRMHRSLGTIVENDIWERS